MVAGVEAGTGDDISWDATDWMQVASRWLLYNRLEVPIRARGSHYRPLRCRSIYNGSPKQFRAQKMTMSFND